MEEKPKKIKVGVVCIVLNPPYWPFAHEMISGLGRFFLKHPDIRDKYATEIMLWSDMPETPEEIQQKTAEYLLQRKEATVSIINSTAVEIILDDNKKKEVENLVQDVLNIRKSAKVFIAESVEWPLPTLLRYNLFLQQ